MDRSPDNPAGVKVSRRKEVLPTYEPLAADKNPMFLEKRVYQGSSGAVYPLPFYDRIASVPTPRGWDAIVLENQFLEVMILPEIGGRIHAGRDKTNGYDFFYRQDVIKPALVGLAGPWASGGVEFNWPQHHRPATFMPVETAIEHGLDGSITVWCSDHDPMTRMKGMHGVCLHPDKAYVELKVRAHNRTPLVQTFLWWANVATKVHENYQSFFPPDVYYVADHARRSMSEYPLCQGHYYGVNYGERGRSGVPAGEAPAQFVPPASGGRTAVGYAADDLSFYANISVPTSYMCMGSKEDFFGGYDHGAAAGLVHVANHHIAPGKKQWTWGNHEFGYAWDRNLTDPDAGGVYAPYIEIMAGVYTDNQPDFAFLGPGETKTWSQYWYPIQEIGPAHHANVEIAVSLRVEGAQARVGVSPSARFGGATVQLQAGERTLAAWTRDLAPGAPFLELIELPVGIAETDLRLRVRASDGREIIAYAPKPRVRGEVPPPATEPPAPNEIESIDELYLNGLHLEQYRHATRDPSLYWREALRRDPGDSRCNNAMGRWLLRRGEFSEAEAHLRRAVARQTARNGNPYDGEPYYNLGLTLRFLGRDEEAYASFYKATWNQAWQSAGYFALAELDGRRARWSVALDHLDRSLRCDVDHLGARSLRALVLRRLGDEAGAAAQLQSTRARDPLDAGSRALVGETATLGASMRMDVALDWARAGFYQEAIELLRGVVPQPGSGLAPMLAYTLGWLLEQAGDPTAGADAYFAGAHASPDYCFPSRLEDILILEAAIRANPLDARAPYYLGNLLYDRRRHKEAVRLWEVSAKLDPTYPVVWRNLGIAYFNISGKPTRARAAYDRAVQADPSDARLLFERDQLCKRLGDSPSRRLRVLERRRDLVDQRDDLSVELCALYNQTGQPEKALEIVSTRKFQPWEGGEGQALGQHARTHVALGRAGLERSDADHARRHFAAALGAPANLSEARHLLANSSDLHYWMGLALDALGDRAGAERHWTLSAEFRGDFQEMSVRAFSEMTYYSALSLERLGRKSAAREMFRELLAYAKKLEKAEAKIDYFATSLPTMLLFDDDLTFRQRTMARFLQAQAYLGLGKKRRARCLLAEVIERDPNHALAADLLTGTTAFAAARKSKSRDRKHVSPAKSPGVS